MGPASSTSFSKISRVNCSADTRCLPIFAGVWVRGAASGRLSHLGTWVDGGAVVTLIYPPGDKKIPPLRAVYHRSVGVLVIWRLKSITFVSLSEARDCRQMKVKIFLDFVKNVIISL